MKQKQKNNQLKKEINFKCSDCQTIYRLLEIKLGKTNSNCYCLSEWKEILSEYHHKEMVNFLNEKDNESEDDE